MKRKYGLLILGATAYGIAMANRYKDLGVAVIEAGCTCAPEFSAAYKGEYAAPSDNDLYRELEKRRAVSGGRIWLPAVGPVAASLLAGSGADCLFFSAVTGIRREGGGYAVTFSCYGTEYGLYAGRIVDTTGGFVSRAWFGGEKPSYIRRSLNYIGKSGEVRTSACGDDIASARLSLRSEEKIVMIAFEPDVTPEKRDTGVWRPSAAFADASEAYEAGSSAPLPELFDTVTPDVPDDGGYDVIVVGTGTAGSAAALKAAGSGLKVLALESMSVPGGTATAGGIYNYYYGFKGGLYKETDAAAEKITAFTKEPGVGGQPKIIALDSELKRLGVDVRYRAFFTAAETDGKRVTGVRWTENGEIHSASAKYVIDCTAEASVCVSAGCAMLGGRQSDGEYQPFSSVYFTLNPDGSTGFGYCDNGTVDPYDAYDFGRKTLSALCSYVHLRENYGDHGYLGTAPLIGLREGRKIKGEETVSFEDLIRGRYTQEPVYYGRSNLDNHGKDDALEDRIYRDWVTICGMWGWCLPIPVPMGALIPEGREGILAAGRDVSVEHNLAMGLRMKDDAYKSGEAAAAAAALSIKSGAPARDVDRDELRAGLAASGCLNLGENVMDLEQQNNAAWYHEPWWTDDDGEIERQLASDAPGYAIWSAMMNGRSDLLKKLLDGGCVNARRHAALSLALLGDTAAVDALIETAYSRDGFVPKSGRKYNNLRSVSAISALGRLGDKKAAGPLLDLLEDLSFTEGLKPTDSGMISDSGDVRFEYESHIITALSEIAAKNPGTARGIKERLIKYTENRRFLISMMGTRTDVKKDCTDSIRKIVEGIDDHAV